MKNKKLKYIGKNRWYKFYHSTNRLNVSIVKYSRKTKKIIGQELLYNESYIGVIKKYSGCLHLGRSAGKLLKDNLNKE